MLDTIRRHQQSWLTYLIFVAIIVVFAVNFGPGSSSCRGGAGANYAAIVDGDYVRQTDYALNYSRQIESMRRRFAGASADFTSEMAERMGLKQQVLDQLIEVKVLAHEARRRGLVITDEELLQHLRESYGVKEVSREQYRNWVERVWQTNVQQFENDERQKLLAQKLGQLVTENITVSDAELRAQFMRERDRAMIEYVKFDLTSVKLAEPTAAEIDALLAAEKKAVEDRYNADQFAYRTPEFREARHILIKLAKDASDADVAKARSTLSTLKDQIESGSDFAALAKQYSEDEATKDNGGNLGQKTRAELPAAVAAAVFSLKGQELTVDPVRSDSGLHLVQLVSVKAPERKPLAEVERDVAASILRERNADARLAESANALLAELKSGKALDALTVSEDEAKEPAEPAPDTNKKLAAPAAAKPVRYESAWIVKGADAIPRIGVAPEMMSAIFALTKEAPLAPQAFKVGRAYYVAVLKERELPDDAKFAAEKEQLREQAVWGKRSEVLQAWVKHLRQSATVDLNPALFAPPGESEG